MRRSSVVEFWACLWGWLRLVGLRLFFACFFGRKGREGRALGGRGGRRVGRRDVLLQRLFKLLIGGGGVHIGEEIEGFNVVFEKFLSEGWSFVLVFGDGSEEGFNVGFGAGEEEVEVDFVTELDVSDEDGVFAVFEGVAFEPRLILHPNEATAAHKELEDGFRAANEAALGELSHLLHSQGAVGSKVKDSDALGVDHAVEGAGDVFDVNELKGELGFGGDEHDGSLEGAGDEVALLGADDQCGAEDLQKRGREAVDVFVTELFDLCGGPAKFGGWLEEGSFIEDFEVVVVGAITSDGREQGDGFTAGEGGGFNEVTELSDVALVEIGAGGVIEVEVDGGVGFFVGEDDIVPSLRVLVLVEDEL